MAYEREIAQTTIKLVTLTAAEQTAYTRLLRLDLTVQLLEFVDAQRRAAVRKCVVRQPRKGENDT